VIEGQTSLDAVTARAFAAVAARNVVRPFPHKLDVVLASDPDPAAADHVAMHPVFSGSFDWHSAVHMHWLLVRVLRLHPAIPEADGIADLLAGRLSPARLAVERRFFDLPGQAIFERPYGWAWLLELRAELERLGAEQPRARAWAEAVDPLARDLADRLTGFLAAAAYPIRSGVHASTAFAGILALDYAAACGAAALTVAVQAAARRWHARDRDAPLAYEPSLTDFLSPTLTVAALMGAVLSETEFPGWLAGFLPRGIGPLAEPPVVCDRRDPQLAHLDGLCLSRAWCFRRIARRVPADHPLRPELARAARRHLAAGLPFTVGGDYAGEHWLASFAALALGEPADGTAGG